MYCDFDTLYACITARLLTATGGQCQRHGAVSRWVGKREAKQGSEKSARLHYASDFTPEPGLYGTLLNTIA